VTGKNGHGKSSIFEALCFGLFNKSFRGINKPALVNTINQKALRV
jgi:DNA repair exonuclease SbcCD ATPase subunit